MIRYMLIECDDHQAMTQPESIRLPYHKTHLTLSDNDVRAVLTNRLGQLPAAADRDAESALVRSALDTPIASAPLEDLARGKRDICIITSDHTRPVPSGITMPILLERIRSGNPEADITILIATGFHRPTTREELIEKFGRKIVDNERIVMHLSDRDEDMVEIGILPSGGRCIINRRAVEADLLIAEGFIEPHFFAGYSGGRKAVLPGVASRTTVLANHCAEFIAHPKARTGNLEGNPLHEDMIYAAETAGLAFILNVMLDEDKRIVHAVSGHFDKAHRAGCSRLSDYVRVPRSEGDIVVTTNGGYPLDQNVYQAVKGMSTAESCCRDGGVIVMVAACSDGHGGEDFYRHVRDAESPAALLEEVMRIPPEKTLPDQWEYQILSRILSRFTVILVTDMADHGMILDMKMTPAADLETAMRLAREHCSIRGITEPEIVVIPDGVGVVIE